LPIEEGSGDSRLDLFSPGPLQELLGRFRERLIETAYTIAGRSPANANHLEQAYDVLLSQDPHWSAKNRRRVYLIRKKVSAEISPSELDELNQLQVEADRHMSKVAPRPLEALWELEKELLGRGPEADEDSEEQ